MNFGFEQNLTIEQKQQLALTPALIQAIGLLRLSGSELEEFVREQMESNPVLERTDSRQLPANDFTTFDQYTAAAETLTDYLMVQLEISAADSNQLRIGQLIIDFIDDHGYLTVSLNEIEKLTGADIHDIRKALHLIHTFDPAGVGARNLAECLMIQLHQAGILTPEFRTLLKDHLKDIENNRLKVIAKSMDMKVHKIQDMVDILRKLNPNPGLVYSSSQDSRYIVPDIHVVEEDGIFTVKHNDDSSPQLMVSSYYKQMLSRAGDDPEVTKYLKEKVSSAMWLINSIQQRKNTILKISEAIVEHQQDFFRYGSSGLKKMTLHTIAESSGVHESTVSRAVNGKYLHCEHGLYELRYFFTSGDSGGNSSRSIKTLIAAIIRDEDPYRPLSDQKITELLKEKGVSISRRTTAKYREEMNISSSSKRKRF